MKIATFIIISALTLTQSFVYGSGYPYRKREAEAFVAAASKTEENAHDPSLDDRDAGSVIHFNTGSGKGHGYVVGHHHYYGKRDADGNGYGNGGYGYGLSIRGYPYRKREAETSVDAGSVGHGSYYGKREAGAGRYGY